jgi:group I intron endonuclease
MASTFICYRIVNTINGKKYIGFTGQSLGARFMAHKRDAKRGSTVALHRAMRRHGVDAFSVCCVATFKDAESAKAHEVFLIDSENTMPPYGYNMTIGGDGCVKLCDEASEKKKIAVTEKHKDATFKEKHRQGCKDSWDEARRQAASKRHSGKTMHPNAAKAIREAKKTQEYREVARRAAKATWDKPGFREEWIRSKLLAHISKAKRFPMREDGLIFSSTRRASAYMRESGHHQAAPNNICMACNGKYKTSYGFTWKWVDGDQARAAGGIIE